MNSTLRLRARLHRQSGTSMLEYTIIAVALTTSLFVIPVSQGMSAAAFLASSINSFYSNLTFFLSLP